MKPEQRQKHISRLEREIKQLKERIASKQEEIEMHQRMMKQFEWKQENTITVCDVLLNGVHYRASLSSDQTKMTLHGGKNLDKFKIKDLEHANNLLRNMGFSPKKY